MQPVTIFSAPRRFDLATMLAVTTAYALMFGTMRMLDADNVFMLVTGLYVSFIALSQALLFGGKHPRWASIVSSVGFAAGSILIAILSGQFSAGDIFALMVACVIVFPPLGYLTGALIGGVFLIAHHLRQWLDKPDRVQPSHSAGPWLGDSPDDPT